MRTIRRLDDPAVRAVSAIGALSLRDELGLTPMLEAGLTDFLGKLIRMERFLCVVGPAVGRVI